VAKKAVDKWQYGDFQTPQLLAEKVINVLKYNHNIDPDIIIEPSCGKGAFIFAANKIFANVRIYGFDINPSYIKICNSWSNSNINSNILTVQEEDFFNYNWDKFFTSFESENILILGNPPWVTSSELGILNSKNIPKKSNFQNRRGIEAITGSGNFDISEWMILKYIQWLHGKQGTIAVLCKYSVARKIMKQIRQDKDIFFAGYIYSIDAKVHFNASVEACLFILITEVKNSDYKVYNSIEHTIASNIIGERDGSIIRNVENYEKLQYLKGENTKYIWRSGLKHDASKTMELTPYLNGYKNGFDEFYRLEDEFIYPLLKSSDVANGRISSYRKVVIVTQKFVGEDTSKIKNEAPKTWGYLIEHEDLLNKRKSSIYKNKPNFSIFGIGDYTFKPWKIAISALYKKLAFYVISPINNKPIIFDDTINFLSFDTEEEAKFIYSLLISEPALTFLDSMIFWDEKRPITTKILRKLSLREVATELKVLNQYLIFEDRESK